MSRWQALRRGLRQGLRRRSALRETNRCLRRIAMALESLAARHGAHIVDLEADPPDDTLQERWDRLDPLKDADYGLLEEISDRFTADIGRGPTEEELLGQFDQIRRQDEEILALRTSDSVENG